MAFFKLKLTTALALLILTQAPSEETFRFRREELPFEWFTSPNPDPDPDPDPAPAVPEHAQLLEDIGGLPHPDPLPDIADARLPPFYFLQPENAALREFLDVKDYTYLRPLPVVGGRIRPTRELLPRSFRELDLALAEISDIEGAMEWQPAKQGWYIPEERLREFSAVEFQLLEPGKMDDEPVYWFARDETLDLMEMEIQRAGMAMGAQGPPPGWKEMTTPERDLAAAEGALGVEDTLPELQEEIQDVGLQVEEQVPGRAARFFARILSSITRLFP